MICKICQKEFKPNKYRPNQQVCSSPECQHLRQIINEKDWRLKNPEYFKCRDQDASWKASRRQYTRKWQDSHKGYLEKYQKAHRRQRREYMREYMRRYRASKANKVQKNPEKNGFVSLDKS